MPKPIIPFWSSDETKSPLLLKEDDVILENNSAEKLPEPTRDALRPEIQGLRAIAISSVLLFHMWGSKFKVGYLGVDVFFVISGYLMIMLLSRKSELTLKDSTNFYYRRIKRIVPLYVFIITLTIIASYNLITDYDVGQIFFESIPALLFYSNLPFVHKTGYFDMKSKYKFFLHTWSLSTEIQFYLFVPLLVLIIGFLNKRHFLLRFVFIAALGVISFLSQVYSSSNSKHMTLDGRIWQFLVGFLAYFAYKSKLLNWNISNKGEKNRLVRILLELRNAIPVLLLILTLTIDFLDVMEHQIQRLPVVFLTALIISIRNTNQTLLGSDTLVNLGDVSYSIYLIHWPIFTMDRYLDNGIYEGNKEAGHMVGSYLIGISIILGYLLEKTFKRILKYVNNWRNLLYLLFILYLAAGISLCYIYRDALSPVEYASSINNDKRLEDTIMLWNTRKDGQAFSNSQTMAYNSEIAYIRPICQNTSRVLPSKFKDLSEFEDICHESGMGNKTIIVIGNSHGFSAFIGITHMFKPISKHIILISHGSCVQTSEKYQFRGMSKKEKEICVRYITNVIQTIKEFDEPIDIIVPLFGWVAPQTYTDIEAEELYHDFQSFYGNLSTVVKEFVFVPQINVLFSKSPLKLVQNKLKYNVKIGRIGESKTKLMSTMNEIDRQIQRVECEKCLKINWLNLWCEAGADGFCDAVDPRRHLSYFYDTNHCTTYGIFYMADYMLSIYNKEKSHQNLKI